MNNPYFVKLGLIGLLVGLLVDQQNNNASNFVFNPKSTILEPKRKPGDEVNIVFWIMIVS